LTGCLWTRAINSKTVRNVALQVVIDRYNKKCRLIALGMLFKTILVRT